MAATRREFSSGGVVYKRNQKPETRNQIMVALIARKNKTVWCLPKGKIEKGEADENAAAREIEEETGLTGRLIKRLGDIVYWYVSPIDKARVFKNVRFFLFEYSKGSFSSHDPEVDEVRWFTIPQALKIMSYPSEKKIMCKAKEAICSS